MKRAASAFSLLHRERGPVGILKSFFTRVFPPGSPLWRMYKHHILKYTTLDVYTFLVYKCGLLLLAFLLLLLVRATDRTVQMDEILHEYRDAGALVNWIHGSEQDVESIRKEEQILLQDALHRIPPAALKQKPGAVLQTLEGMLKKFPGCSRLPPDMITQRILQRMQEYYRVRRWNIGGLLAAAVAVSYLLEISFAGYNAFSRTEARRELRFLKKLIILNGSIKPVDFQGVLDEMILRSRYHKQVLLKIRDMNRRNSTDLDGLYQELMRQTRDISLKLFLEKLGQANHYNFDQAIAHIAYEFALEKREMARKVRKRMESINILGVTGFMIIILIMMVYLLTPWMQMYSMNDMGF